MTEGGSWCMSFRQFLNLFEGTYLTIYELYYL